MLEMATHWCHVWSLERNPEGGAKVKDLFGDLSRIKDLTDEIYQNFLDESRYKKLKGATRFSSQLCF